MATRMTQFGGPRIWLVCLAASACGGLAVETHEHQPGSDSDDPKGTLTSAPLESDRADPILTDPALNGGVTSILQPSYFRAATAQGTAAAAGHTETFQEGATLEGSGDLTVLLVFDKSSSMLRDWEGKTRWQAANESLREALEGVLDELTIGVIQFPLGGACAVTEFGEAGQIDFTSGRQFVAQWRQMEHRLPSLGTPLLNALRVADRAISQADAEGRLEQRFRVVLVTDGEPTCNDSVDLAKQLVAKWHGLGVETVVLGLPGSLAATTTLDALAVAGGTGHFTFTETHDELMGGFSAASR